MIDTSIKVVLGMFFLHFFHVYKKSVRWLFYGSFIMQRLCLWLLSEDYIVNILQFAIAASSKSFLPNDTSKSFKKYLLRLYWLPSYCFWVCSYYSYLRMYMIILFFEKTCVNTKPCINVETLQPFYEFKDFAHLLVSDSVTKLSNSAS